MVLANERKRFGDRRLFILLRQRGEATPLEAEGSRIATSRGCCLCSHVLAAAVATPAATRTPPLARFVQTATSERESKDRAAEAASA